MGLYLSRRTIRPLLAGLGLVILFSGVTALMFPRPLIVGHQFPRFIFWMQNYVVERVSKEGCIVYGIFATLLGLGFLYAAYLGDLRVLWSDRAVAEGIVTVAPELLRNYGRIEDCTQAQVVAMSRKLKVSRAKEPYLCAAFLGRDELKSLEARMPGVNWGEVEQRIDRILIELPHEDLVGSHFHESWHEPAAIR